MGCLCVVVWTSITHKSYYAVIGLGEQILESRGDLEWISQIVWTISGIGTCLDDIYRSILIKSFLMLKDAIFNVSF